METYINEADILVSIKKHRDSLSYDELFDVEMETSKMKLSDKTREKLRNKPTASQVRMKRYGLHKDKRLPMKLYPEEQVKKAYKDGNLDGFSNVSALDMCIDSLTPIELPSDEEIEKAADKYVSEDEFNRLLECFEQGAKWMKEKILNQNK